MSEFVYDDRAESFFQIGDVAYLIAAKHCGVDVDTITHDRWRELLGLLREVDTAHDDIGASEQTILAALESFKEFEDRYPNLSPESLGEETQQKLLMRCQRILKLGARASETSSIDEFVQLRTDEGLHTANLLEDSATDFAKNQPEFHAAFLPAMQSLGVTATLLDSILDHHVDYQAGSVELPPSKRLYKTLGKAALQAAPAGMKAVMHKSILYEFGVMSKNRLVNRIKYPKSNTTSLRIFGRE